MPNVLILGSSRGLGSSLLSLYAARRSTHIYGTTRSSSSTPASSPQKNITYIPSIDIASETAGPRLVEFLKPLNLTLDIVIISAGYFATETFNTPNWAEELKMYTTSAIGPVFIIHALTHASLLTQPGAKIILVSSESGSIALRHEKEGGGNYGHHASKAALNMVGKLLSLDLRDKGIGVGIVHPGFMRTEMTRGVGFDKYWDEGGGKSYFSPFLFYFIVRVLSGNKRADR